MPRLNVTNIWRLGEVLKLRIGRALIASFPKLGLALGWRLSLLISVAAAASPAVVAACDVGQDQLPQVIDDSTPARIAAGTAWSIDGIVGIRWISDIAIANLTDRAAFIVKQSFPDSGATRYGLYTVDIGHPGSAVKLVESSFLADLSSDPASDLWTLRAECGLGVQLYEIDAQGRERDLVVNSATAVIGGALDGLVGALGSPQRTGVRSYQWAPDGSVLWYSKLRLRSQDDYRTFADNGIVFDERTMNSFTLRNYLGLLLGTELHVFNPKTNEDRLLAIVPSLGPPNFNVLRRDLGTAWWSWDSLHILYAATEVQNDGSWKTNKYRVDARSGHIDLLPKDAPTSLVPAPSGSGFLGYRDGHLVGLDQSGADIRDYGRVPFREIDMGSGLGAWHTPRSKRAILAVRYHDHDGLIEFPALKRNGSWTTLSDSLGHCDFNSRGTLGVCVRESIEQPPELDLVLPRDGTISTLLRINKQYDQIPVLKTQYTHWTNRYGSVNDGYITFPRNYEAGRSYPAILVTHGAGARNKFVDEGFQLEFPLQVFPELGYFVVAVNEPDKSYGVRRHFEERLAQGRDAGVRQTQFDLVLDGVASIEAALQSLVRCGMVDSEMAGIAGYSRGGDLALYAMGLSKMFKAAAIGDAGAGEDSYWAYGSKLGRQWQLALYGGSPYDADAEIQANYRAISPAFRANQFAGPLLQLFPTATATEAFEIRRFLEDAHVPAELVLFPDEAHVFWKTAHRATAMQKTLDWFNYWLRGEMDSSPRNQAQYQRWQAMESEWRSTRR
jgi:dipeptidyl aminopeptidase/acylaminoacyl peptidase